MIIAFGLKNLLRLRVNPWLETLRQPSATAR
jgi:hypothetical protein